MFFLFFRSIKKKKLSRLEAVKSNSIVMSGGSTSQKQLEIATQKKGKYDLFKAFILKHKVNPLNEKRILIAKDLSYRYQESDDSLLMLIPLSVKDLYLYVSPYVDPKTELTEYAIRISHLEDLVPCGALHNGQNVYAFDSSKSRKNPNNVRLAKGSRFVPFLSRYFDEDKNKTLYKNSTKNMTIHPSEKKYDTDNDEYKEKSGYVELVHQRVAVQGKYYGYVQIIACQSYKGDRKPPKLTNILSGELSLVSAYLKFVIGVYKMDVESMSDDGNERYKESGRLDVVETIMKLAKKNALSAKQDDGEIAGSSSRKRKTAGGSVKTVAGDDCDDSLQPAKPKKKADKNKKQSDDENIDPSSKKKKEKIPRGNVFLTSTTEEGNDVGSDETSSEVITETDLTVEDDQEEDEENVYVEM